MTAENVNKSNTSILRSPLHALRTVGNALRTGGREFRTGWQAGRPIKKRDGVLPIGSVTHGSINARRPLGGGGDASLEQQSHGHINRDLPAMPGFTNKHASPARRTT
jgi:hypothetical protein